MRTIFLFIWKNNFFFLFFLLEIFSIYLVIQNNNYQNASAVNSANDVAGSVMQTYSDVNDYFRLKKTNEELAHENAVLYSMLKQSFRKNSTSVNYLKDTIYKQQYLYISAKVVNNSTNLQKNYLTLDKGYKDGIKTDMGVICPLGIVGKVKDVSANFCTVMSVLHKDNKISCMLKRDGSFGPLSWDGDDYRYATLTDIPTHVQMKNGDTVLTSAYSTIFPEGIMVGTIESFERKSSEYFYTVNVKLSTDFKKLKYVYIIGNLMKEEQETVEKKSSAE
jgi:rod shape-determining protein MreC